MIEYFLIAFLAGADGGARPPEAPPEVKVIPPPPPVAPADFRAPVRITAKRFEVQGKEKEAVWTGNVRAVRGRTVLTCNRLVAHYTEKQEISRLECIGDVTATHGDMWAKGQRADFDNEAGLLVVTGSPEARKGPNYMRGKTVYFDVTRDLVTVEQAIITVPSTPTQGLKKGRNRR